VQHSRASDNFKNLNRYKNSNFEIVYSGGFLISPFKMPFADHLEEILKRTVFHKILLNQIVVGKRFSK